MKHINTYIIAAATGALLISAAPAFAEVVVGTQANATVKAENQANMQKRREAMTAKIGQIKDKAQMNMASKLVEQSGRVNTVWTTHFNARLDHLGRVMVKINSRSQKAAANGKDVAAVNAAMQKASDSIATARAAVAAQAAKTYSIDASVIVGTTTTTAGQNALVSKLRSQFKIVKDQVFKDLMVLRDGQIKEARASVQLTLEALKQIPGVDQEPTNQ